jgi:hypothetical protein
MAGSSRNGRRRLGWARVRKRSGQGPQQRRPATMSSQVRRRAGASVGSGTHCVRSLHCRCQPFAQCSCSLSSLVFRMGLRPGAGTCSAAGAIRLRTQYATPAGLQYRNLNSSRSVARLAKHPVGVEKVHFLQNSPNLGDGKCLGKPRKSFVELPIAKFFRASSGE